MHNHRPIEMSLPQWIALGVFLLTTACTPTVPDSATSSEASERPSYDVDAMAQSMHEAINEERAREGLESLSWSENLAPIAKAHSQDMRDRGFFSHENPDGESPTDRGNAYGFTCEEAIDGGYRTGIGENIFNAALYSSRQTRRDASGTTVTYDWNEPSELVETVVEGWMDSPGHRRNILSSDYASQGLGLTLDSDENRLFVTQKFC